jgi:hypothetical protein
MGTLSTPDASERRTLRDLSLPARLVLSAFLISVGIGYFSALVQLHFQQAPPGTPLPGPADVVNNYFGQPPASTLERIISTPEHMPFTSSGSMRAAFTTQSVGWDEFDDRIREQFARDKYIRDKSGADFEKLTAEEKKKLSEEFDDLPKEMKETLQSAFEKLEEAEQAQFTKTFIAGIRAERDGEAAALVHWIRHGLDKKSYEDDAYVLPDDLKDAPITKRYVREKDSVKSARVWMIVKDRCVRCHKETGSSAAADAPLDTYGRVKSYTKPDTHGTGIGLKKLAQSTHVHLLGFSMLYGLTGLIFAFTSYPTVIRLLIAPAALLAQIVDISFWWLARLPAPQGPQFAKAIIISGGVVGASLAAQILLSLFNMFGWMGRLVLILAILAALGGGYFAKDVVQNYLDKEKHAPARVN